jgi:ActR/RegA family two-component response regulator
VTRILILVEDDDSKAKAVTRMATNRGFTVLRAKTLAESADLIGRFHVSKPSVVTDWCFPTDMGESAKDGNGLFVVMHARLHDLSIRVFSGRDVPEKGYEDIWFDSGSVTGIQAWLEAEAKR